MNIKSLSHQAKRWYDFNLETRRYHNWDHACAVVNNCHRITAGTPSDSLILAAWWHDAVYVPYAGTDANERCSAAALGSVAKQADHKEPLSKEIKDAVNEAQDLIEFTCIKYHMWHQGLTGDLAILLDADLGSLALPYADFLTNQANILEENGTTMAAHRPESAAFLHQFLTCRPFIYHTEYAQKHWEKAARTNIARYCNES